MRPSRLSRRLRSVFALQKPASVVPALILASALRLLGADVSEIPTCLGLTNDGRILPNRCPPCKKWRFIDKNGKAVSGLPHYAFSVHKQR